MSRVLLLLVFCAINAMRLLWNHYFISLYFTIYFSISLHIPAMPLLLLPLSNVSRLIYISHIDVYHRHRLSTVWHVPTEQPTLFFINVLFSLFCFVSPCECVHCSLHSIFKCNCCNNGRSSSTRHKWKERKNNSNKNESIFQSDIITFNV